MIDKNLEHLQEPFRTFAKVFLEVFKMRHPNVAPFETLRTRGRQLTLMATGKSRTMNSYHLKWLAVDRVFNDAKGQPTRKGDYYQLQWIGAMCGMRRIKQELCHTERNGNTIKQQIEANSARYMKTQDPWEHYRLHLVNEALRKHLLPTK